MALLTVQHSGGASGLTVAWSNAAPGGDSFPSTGAQTLQVRNLSASTITVTIAAQTACSQGTLHSLPFSVAAGATMMLGPFSYQFYNDASGNVQVTYSTTVLAAPGVPTLAAGAAGTPNGTYKCQVTFVNAQGETIGGAEATVTVTSQRISWSNIPLGPTTTTARKLYRTAAGGATGTEKLVGTINDNTTTTFDDNVADGSLGAAVPVTNTATVLQVAVTAL